ncbi:MAG: GNAT family N-acetyltransferase [Propionibacteriaceae bacterium]|nr:GNAT family N-acetyltransferase [Propionibacteriaceae bacterium]
MQIRAMSISDYDDVHRLWVATPGMGLNDIDDSRDGIARYLNRNPSSCFVAENGSRLIGAILSGHDGRRGFIYHTCVALDARFAGVGRALVDAALAALRDEGITKVALVVFARNEGGIAFWEHLGFTVRSDLNYRNRALRELERIDT